MVGSLAQMVALVCHGNAAIAGSGIPQLFPANSTMQFCDAVTFTKDGPSRNGERETITAAGTPDQWIQNLQKEHFTGLRLLQQPRNNPGFPDRMSAGFVGGGKSWTIEAIRSDSRSEYWLSKWEVGNREAPNRRIWKVTYHLCNVVDTCPSIPRPLEPLAGELRAALTGIRAFSERHNCGGFTECFESALHALDEPEADIGYHKDLYPYGLLASVAQSLLKAAMAAWVFGGMGSWNDMGFPDEEGVEYERVSDRLFSLLNEAVEAAATSSFPHS